MREYLSLRQVLLEHGARGGGGGPDELARLGRALPPHRLRRARARPARRARGGRERPARINQLHLIFHYHGGIP